MPRYSNDEALFTRHPPGRYLPLAVTAIPAGTAQQVVPAVTAPDVDPPRVLIVNNGTVALTYSPFGVATAASVPLGVGLSVELLAPSADGVSVFCPSGGAAGSVTGYQY